MAPIRQLKRTSPTYPTLLGELTDYPPTLFVRGNVATLSQPAIAVVGSRNMTPYGEAVCQRLVTQLVANGFCIISGLATGIDTVAHRTALECNGSTVAVVANGLDANDMYPAENTALASDIVASRTGAVISEYGSGTKAKRYHFPARNRIIAGLTSGTVVVEARLRSGALITARRALEYNREVFAIPGSILSTQSAGTNHLINQGAVTIHSIDAAVETIVAELPSMLVPPQAMLIGNSKDHSNATTVSDHYSLNPIAEQIINTLSGQACSVETLCQYTELPTAKISIYLTELEIKGIVRKNIDFTYSLL